MDAIKDYSSWKYRANQFPFTLPNGIWTYIYSDVKNYHLSYKRTEVSVKSEIYVSGGFDSSHSKDAKVLDKKVSEDMKILKEKFHSISLSNELKKANN